MGGGSSDAATTLLALNRLWQLGLDAAQLSAIGVQLGADVPFFLGGTNAWVEGIGEKLTPVALPRARFAVVKPPQGLETARIFRDPALNRSSAAAIISGFAANPFAFGTNDLQPVAQRLCPAVDEALQWLGSQGLQGRMTGSGSAVFALLSQGVRLKEAPPGWLVRECGNLEIHPLARWVSRDDSSVVG
jgi:4-diphosphocytidyl-2-C-methyl-D-erythritol kinase